MKCFITLVFVFFVAALATADEEKYSTKFDDMDVETMLKNKKIKENYANCILDKGKCTEAGQLVKTHLADALATKCAKCSDKQIENAKKILRNLHEEDPELLKEFAAKYDPNGTYKKEIIEWAKKQGYDVKE